MYLLHFILNFVIIFIAIYTKSLDILSTYLVCFSVLYFCEKKVSIHQKLFIYFYLAFWGSIAYLTYYVFCGNTFAPYHDDSYYFLNIKNIFDGNLEGDATLYEYFLSFIYFLFSPFVKLSHTLLLPINWLMGTLCIVKAIRFANAFCENKRKSNFLSIGLFIFCAPFLEGTIHLYRDPLMCLLLILSIEKLYNHRYLKGTILTFLTGLVRGANGMILLMYDGIQYFISKFKLNKKSLAVCVILLVFTVISLDKFIGINNYLRGFSSGGDDTESIVSSIYDRREIFLEGEGGVVSLLRSDNILLNIIAVPIYMISPISAGPLVTTESYIIRDEPSYTIVRFRIESILELISSVFYGFLFIRIMIGGYYWSKEKDINKFSLFLIFLIMVLLVTFISMQHRHKMMFIMLYPILLNYYDRYTKNKKTSNIISICSVCVILLYNII